MSARVYVPATPRSLAAYVEAGTIPASAERVVAETDDEQDEYDALMTAADVSAELLGGPGRRVVVVAEVRDADAEIPLRRVVAVHVDTEDVDGGEDRDLAWYATQELPDLLTRLR